MENLAIQQKQAQSVGKNYEGKIQSVYIENMSLYLGKTLTIGPKSFGNFNPGESVWIIKLKDPNLHKNFIMVSNKTFVSWISLEQIIRS